MFHHPQLVNKCSCKPETELSKLFCKFVVRLLDPDSKFLLDLPKLKLFTRRVLRSLVSKDVPADLRSLKRGDKSWFENLVEKFVTGEAESISCFELFSTDQLEFIKVFLFHFWFKAYFRGFLNCFASVSEDNKLFFAKKSV